MSIFPSRDFDALMPPVDYIIHAAGYGIPSLFTSGSDRNDRSQYGNGHSVNAMFETWRLFSVLQH